MKPVKQTILHDSINGIKGNCFTACVASIMELPIEQVPYFANIEKDWYLHFMNFMEKHNWEEDITYNVTNPPLGYSIACGLSPRGIDLKHSCVAYCGKIVFDPHPDNTGLSSIEYYYVLKPIEPKLKNLCENNKVE